MSRIIRAPVDAGQVITATDLNNTYNDYNQPTALQADNTRDQAFDLPHFQNVVIIKNTQLNALGNTGMLHSAPVTTVASELAAPIVVHPVQDAAGTETRMSFGANGWVLVAGDCLRVWWNLSLKCYYTGSPWDNASALGRYNIPSDTSPPGNVVITDGFHCWLAYLQWDITSAALTNFVAVPGQSDPTTIGAYEGFYTQFLNGGTVISPWTVSSYAFANNGVMPAGNKGVGFNHEWFAPYGMFVHAPSGQVTVYGIRLVITGILHSGHLASGDQENVLIYDYNVGDKDQYIEYKGGRISAVHQRLA